MRPLWEHQDRGIAELRLALHSGSRRPMFQLPTGGGKTLTAAAIISSARAKGNRVTFVVPAIELIDQTVEALRNEGILDIGVMQADHESTDGTKPVQVASVQTLSRRGVPDTDMVIVDEAHRWFKILGTWMEDRPELLFIGLSATPWTKGLGRYYDRLVIAATAQELVAKGVLCPARVFAPSHPDLTGVKTAKNEAGEQDFVQSGLEKVMAPLVGDVVSTWLERGEDRPTLCFAVNRAHAKLLHDQFADAGVTTAYVDKDTSRLDRRKIRAAFHAGEVKVVCNVGVLTMGVDWDVRCIILARPTKSEMLFVQMVGRGMRRADGKDHLLLLDHTDTTLRLGFVTDIGYPALDDGVTRPPAEVEVRPPPKPRECLRCSCLCPPHVPDCPSCGFKPERAPMGFEWREGELVEIATPTDKRKANRTDDWPEKIAFIRQLRAYAIEKGIKVGWAGYKYKEKYGVMPNDPRVRNARPAAAVTAEVRSWIKSRQIAYAKSRERAEA